MRASFMDVWLLLIDLSHFRLFIFQVSKIRKMNNSGWEWSQRDKGSAVHLYVSFFKEYIFNFFVIQEVIRM